MKPTNQWYNGISKKELLNLFKEFKRLDQIISSRGLKIPKTTYDYVQWHELVVKFFDCNITDLRKSYNFSTTDDLFLTDILKSVRNLGPVKAKLVLAHNNISIPW